MTGAGVRQSPGLERACEAAHQVSSTPIVQGRARRALPPSAGGLPTCTNLVPMTGAGVRQSPGLERACEAAHQVSSTPIIHPHSQGRARRALPPSPGGLSEKTQRQQQATVPALTLRGCQKPGSALNPADSMHRRLTTAGGSATMPSCNERNHEDTTFCRSSRTGRSLDGGVIRHGGDRACDGDTGETMTMHVEPVMPDGLQASICRVNRHGYS